MPREIKGVDALSRAFPSEWLLYVSLNCFPRNQDPMEIDAVVVTDDQILLLEIKDWNGKLTSKGDRWFLNKAPRKRSAVIVSEEKARKLRSVIKGASNLAGAFAVEARVVFTGTADASHLPAQERARTLTLTEACLIGDPSQRYNYIPRGRIQLTKAHQLEAEFEKVFNNPRLFQRSEMDWSGYAVTEKDVFIHPRGVWHDHFSQRKSEPRIKGMVRTWSFDRLPVGLNSGEMRKLVALRETNVFGYLQDIQSDLITRNHVLKEAVAPDDEISTDHFEVRHLGPGWSPLDRYLVQQGDDLSLSDRLVIVSSLLNIVAHLHRDNVTHRDIGPRAVWIGSHSDLALTGFMSCQLPDKNSVMDWLADLRGYAPALPEDASAISSTGRQRDVYACTYLAAQILLGTAPPTDPERVVAALPPEASNLGDWFRRGMASNPAQRFIDAIELTDTFSAIVEDHTPDGFDAALLDRFESHVVPFTAWPPTGPSTTLGLKSIYPHEKDGQILIVKVWMSLGRNRSLASDSALLRLLQSVDLLRSAPIKGLPKFIAYGLSPVGLFVVYERSEGVPLAALTELPENASLPLALELLRAVSALHELGCEHGDISPGNMMINVDTGSVCLIDPFDVSPVGNGAVRTPTMCPTNWEHLNQAAIDRYAALKVTCMLLLLDPGEHAKKLLKDLATELDKPVIESLQVAISSLSKAIVAASAPAAREFILRSPALNYSFGNADKIYVRRKVGDSGLSTFLLTTPSAQLVLDGDGILLTHHRFRQTPFTALAYESASGHGDLPFRVRVEHGVESGFEELYAYLCGHERFATPKGEPQPSVRPPHFDVMWHWMKLVELEEDARVEIVITEILSVRDQMLVCTYENLGKDFDFDEEDIIEIYAGTRRIGRVDLTASALPVAIAITDTRGRISEGDRLRLAGRREQTSMDRRARAVRRILDYRSVVSNLIDYFDPHQQIRPTPYDVKPETEDLNTYHLNDGQKHAFRQVLAAGPVGLLQGPPGTGKTRFIASFVHWLLTRGGCQRILIASQSHEAVNNAIDSLLRLHKDRGTRPSLLRIGSKGITERIRPYHTAELRERYRVKFEAAAKFRFSQLSSSLGVDRAYSSDLFDLDKQVGTLARRCASIQEALKDDETQLAIDRERNRVQRSRVEDAFRSAFRAFAGREPDVSQALQEYEQLVENLAAEHSLISPADVTAACNALKLTNDWLHSLGSPGRNFEEFLAKTRSVVAATCVGVGQTRIRIDAQVFDWVIVDEAARCTPGELAVPIQMARRVLLVGDHLQLRPMFDREMLEDLSAYSPDVKQEELTRSDFERAFTSEYGLEVGVRLTEQYRMDPAICTMVSRCFYEAHDIRLDTSIDRQPTLKRSDIEAPWLSTPMVWIDTQSQQGHEEVQLEGDTTYHNPAEVDAVMTVLERLSEDRKLIEALAKLDDETPIGVICMYSGQKRQLESAWSRRPFDPKFRRLVRIDTVDSYQGKENAIVILSLVRSNQSGSTGHVGNENRCNVATSRAKERLIIVGNGKMWGKQVSSQSPMRLVLEHMNEHPSSSRVLSVEELS
ncbi:AAA domain-containing protein [Paraburkholderia sabiae]|uniref:AAA domain-containing protein n=1 Tax=Paraburkholderia sabiae TaxID=273251 RepID=A0ABU9QS77_9BURK|nr:AAA domain-containing protein [Paraburkholderia sabiae]WJZ76542.1 AAA domain-containing protein [Paraburkholderia sabiae]